MNDSDDSIVRLAHEHENPERVVCQFKEHKDWFEKDYYDCEVFMQDGERFVEPVKAVYNEGVRADERFGRSYFERTHFKGDVKITQDFTVRSELTGDIRILRIIPEDVKKERGG